MLLKVPRSRLRTWPDQAQSIRIDIRETMGVSSMFRSHRVEPMNQSRLNTEKSQFMCSNKRGIPSLMNRLIQKKTNSKRLLPRVMPLLL